MRWLLVTCQRNGVKRCLPWLQRRCAWKRWQTFVLLLPRVFSTFLFAYMLLARVDPILDNQQPEEQHGFRTHYRLEEHIITANIRKRCHRQVVRDEQTYLDCELGLGLIKSLWPYQLGCVVAIPLWPWHLTAFGLGSAMPIFEPGPRRDRL